MYPTKFHLNEVSGGQFYNCNFRLADTHTLWKGGWLECLKDFFSFKLSIRSFEGLWIALSLSFRTTTKKRILESRESLCIPKYFGLLSFDFHIVEETDKNKNQSLVSENSNSNNHVSLCLHFSFLNAHIWIFTLKIIFILLKSVWIFAPKNG